MKAVFLLLVVISLNGCVSLLGTQQTVGGGLTMKLTPDPQQVFSLGTVRMNVDLDNENPRNVSDVNYDIFDTGRLIKITPQPEGALCSGQGDMRPQQFLSFFCFLQAPRIDETSVTTEVNARVSYRTDFPSVQIIEMMTEPEYIRQQSTGQLQIKPQSYAYKDKNIELDVDFSEPLPIVIRPGKDYYIYFTVKNIGNGFVDSLKYRDFFVTQANPGDPQVVDCSNAGIYSPTWEIEPTGKEFPRIACKLTLPQGVTFLENYGLLVLVNYNYEVREKATVEILR